MRIYAGFTHEDAAVGWRQVLSLSASLAPDADISTRIEWAKSDVASQLESYRVELTDAIDTWRMVYWGVHYTWNVLGERTGFNGQAFHVKWLTADRESTECNSFIQGRTPVWTRDKLSDNARTVEGLSYRINSFPTVSDSLDDDPPY